MDPSKPFDSWAQFAEMQALMAGGFSPYKAMMGALPVRYEAASPVVQEIAILATMHNLASMLQNPEALNAAINEALADRAKALAKPG